MLMVYWDHITKPKDWDGWSLNYLSIFAIALAAKLGWHFIAGYSLWQDVTYSKHIAPRSLLDWIRGNPLHITGSSIIWKAITKSIHLVKQGLSWHIESSQAADRSTNWLRTSSYIWLRLATYSYLRLLTLFEPLELPKTSYQLRILTYLLLVILSRTGTLERSRPWKFNSLIMRMKFCGLSPPMEYILRKLATSLSVRRWNLLLSNGGGILFGSCKLPLKPVYSCGVFSPNAFPPLTILSDVPSMVHLDVSSASHMQKMPNIFSLTALLSVGFGSRLHLLWVALSLGMGHILPLLGPIGGKLHLAPRIETSLYLLPGGFGSVEIMWFLMNPLSTGTTPTIISYPFISSSLM